jgi:hypothetical protein
MGFRRLPWMGLDGGHPAGGAAPARGVPRRRRPPRRHGRRPRAGTGTGGVEGRRCRGACPTGARSCPGPVDRVSCRRSPWQGERADQGLREGPGHPGRSARAARRAAGPWPTPVVPAAAHGRRKGRGGSRGRRAQDRLLLGGCRDATRLFKSRLEEQRRCRIVAMLRCSSCHEFVEIVAASIVCGA